MEKLGKERFKKAPVVYSRTVLAIRFNFLVLQSKKTNQFQGRWWFSINALQGSTFNVHNEKSVKLVLPLKLHLQHQPIQIFSSNSKDQTLLFCCLHTWNKIGFFTSDSAHNSNRDPICNIAIWHTVHLNTFPFNLVFRYFYTRNNCDLLWNHLW